MAQFVLRPESKTWCAQIDRSGPPGRQLGGYIPDGVDWDQLNFGQGEGQVRIGGIEWGFYYEYESGDVFVVLHDGEVPLSQAIDFVDRVRKKIFRNDVRVEVLLMNHWERRDPESVLPALKGPWWKFW